MSEDKLPDDLEGRRLALAKWMVSPRNSLTARSMVNRIWQHHFGRGIVRSPNNFGQNGLPPTHPELLDWLARRVHEYGWRLKPLHRLIVTSQAYRQSSVYRETAAGPVAPGAAMQQVRLDGLVLW